VSLVCLELGVVGELNIHCTGGNGTLSGNHCNQITFYVEMLPSSLS
jgi:hypothetical protein